MNYRHQARNVASQGRRGDDILVHMNRNELRGLEALSPRGYLPRNPQTGYPEAFDLESILPYLGIAAAIAAPFAIPALAGGAAAAGAGAGAASAAGAGAAGGTAAGLGSLGAGTAASALPTMATIAPAGVGAAGSATMPLAAGLQTGAQAAGEVLSSTAANLPGATSALEALPQALQAGNGLPSLASIPGTPTTVINGPMGTEAIKGIGESTLFKSPLSNLPPSLQAGSGMPSITSIPGTPTTVINGPMGTEAIKGAGQTTMYKSPMMAGTEPFSFATPDTYIPTTGPEATYMPGDMVPGSVSPQLSPYAAQPGLSSPGLPAPAAEVAKSEPGFWERMKNGLVNQAEKNPLMTGLLGLGLLDTLASRFQSSPKEKKDKSKFDDRTPEVTINTPPEGFRPGIDPEFTYLTYKGFAGGGRVSLNERMKRAGIERSENIEESTDSPIQRVMRNYYNSGARMLNDLGLDVDLYPTVSAENRNTLSPTRKVKFAEGGEVNFTDQSYEPSTQIDPETVQALYQDAMLALQGQSDDPQGALARLYEAVGDEAFKEFLATFGQEMGSGGMSGPGGGLADLVPAQIDGQAPAKLSSGEYVVPAEVVSGLGDGSSEEGIRQLDGMVGRVRAFKHGGNVQPPRINLNQVLPR